MGDNRLQPEDIS